VIERAFSWRGTFRISVQKSARVGQELSAADFVVAARDEGEGFNVSDMLFNEDAGGEGVGGVGGEDGDGALEDDDAVVEVLVDKMDGAASELDSVVEGLLLGM